MPFANLPATTHSGTGGTSDLVLAAITSGPLQQSPTFSDVGWNVSPDPWVNYKITEYTDSTCGTEVQWERGRCPLHAGTTLKRSSISAPRQTYVFGSGVTPSAVNAGPPSFINFTNTAANIRVTGILSADDVYQTPRIFNNTNGGSGGSQADLLGRPCGNVTIAPGTVAPMSIANGTLYVFTYAVTAYMRVTRFSIRVITAGAGSSRLGIYDDDGTGWLGNIVVDTAAAAGGTAFNTGSTGLKTSTITTAIPLRPGFIWMVYQQNNATATIHAAHSPQINQAGTFQGQTIRRGSKAGTYGALPATFSASSGFSYSVTQGTTPLVLLG